MSMTRPDPALEPVRVNLNPGPEYGNNQRRFQGIPGIERDAKGRLWVVWYAGGPDEGSEGPGNYVVVVTSDDDGRTWSPPRLVIDPPDDVRAFDPTLWLSPEGSLWLFWAQSRGTYDGRAGVWFITTSDPTSESPTWSEPHRITDGIALNKPTVLATGEWLLPVGVWVRRAGKNTPEADQHYLSDQIGSAVWASTDSGASWCLRGRAYVQDRSIEKQFDEHMVVERRDGSLWMLVRTHYGIGESISRDKGHTWSPGSPSGIPHVNSRFFIRRLRSGRLLLVRHNPADGQFADLDGRGVRSDLTAYVSDDEGASWKGGLNLDDRVGVSYPDGVEAPDGKLYVIHDYDRRGEREILLSVFTEDDVLEGRLVSQEARLRVLVDKATFAEGEERDFGS